MEGSTCTCIVISYISCLPVRSCSVLAIIGFPVHLALIDKRTKFCLIVASSPNFYEYQIRLFRLITIHQLFEETISYEEYQTKKDQIDTSNYIDAIFLLLNSYPNNLNTFLETIKIITKLENDQYEENAIIEKRYRSLIGNMETREIFFKSYSLHKNIPSVAQQIKELNKQLAKKSTTVEQQYLKHLEESKGD